MARQKLENVYDMLKKEFPEVPDIHIRIHKLFAGRDRFRFPKYIESDRINTRREYIKANFKGWNLKHLARKLEVTEMTVRKDLKVLGL